MGVVWGHFEGTLGVLGVVSLGQLGVTFGLLWDYFEGTLMLVWKTDF